MIIMYIIFFLIFNDKSLFLINKLRYPTKLDQEFDDLQLVDACNDILNKDDNSIKQILYKIKNENEISKLYCIVRILLELDIDECRASLLGWFSINDLIPKTTLLLLFKILLSDNTHQGIKNLTAYTRCLLHASDDYSFFFKKVLNNDHFKYYATDLYKVVSVYNTDDFCSLDKEIIFMNEDKGIYCENLYKHEINVFMPSAEFEIKKSFKESIFYANNMDNNTKRLYFVYIITNTSPPDKPELYPEILSVASDYLIYLLESVSADWNSYRHIAYFKKLGQWIGWLTLAQDKPPSLHILNVRSLLLDSIKNGKLIYMITFMIYYYKNILKIYHPPNPYTVSFLEILSAVYNHESIRLDIKQGIKSFSSMFNCDINIFYRRNVDVPGNTFNIASGIVESDSNLLFTRKNLGGQILYSSDLTNDFMCYLPKADQYSKEYNDIISLSKFYDNHYFTGKLNNVPESLKDEAELPAIISFCLSSNSVLSSTFIDIFVEIFQFKKSVDLVPVFRSAFPNRKFFNIIIEMNLYDPINLNAFFSDLLASPCTNEILKSTIMDYITFIPYQEEFLSTYELLDYTPPILEARSPIYELPSKYNDFLTKFIDACSNHTYNGTTELLKLLRTEFSEPLLMMLLHSVGDDLDVVDFFVSILVRSSSSIPYEVLLKSVMNIDEYYFKTKQNIIFRFLFCLLNSAHSNCNKLVVLSVLMHFSPNRYPSFATSWIQLVMHKNAIPLFINDNSEIAQKFCIDFILTLFRITLLYPEELYKTVLKILLILTTNFPLFFVKYHMLLIEPLPPIYMQFRNIILNAYKTPIANNPPQVGFTICISPDLLTVVNSYFDNTMTDDLFMTNTKYLAITIKKLYDNKNEKRLIWMFVFYCVKRLATVEKPRQLIADTRDNTNNYVTQLFINICNNLRGEMILKFITAIFDQLRFENTHTEAASRLVYALFQNTELQTKEIIFTELTRRLLCVSKPPISVLAAYNNIILHYSDHLRLIFTAKGYHDVYDDVIKTIEKIY